MTLTSKQQLFVQEYLVDLNATQAAIRAGYSASSAYNQGYRLMTNDEIKKNIQEAMDERSERTRIASDRVLEEMSRIAFANMADYLSYDPDGHPCVDLSNLTLEQAAALKDVRIENIGDGRKIQFKLADKLTALVAMSRHLERSMTRIERERRDSETATG
ncbi:MAG: terminase small subunit [Allosphingosinicella sp.]